MSDKTAPTILGLGYKVPDTVRDNDDAIFSYLREADAKKKSEDPNWPPQFVGYDKRHVLREVESLLDIMKPAAEAALQTARVKPEQIDLLLGCASVSQYVVPSDLYELHKKLELPEKALTVPLGNDFSNFNVALVLADALIRAKRAETDSDRNRRQLDPRRRLPRISSSQRLRWSGCGRCRTPTKTGSGRLANMARCGGSGLGRLEQFRRHVPGRGSLR